VADTVGAAQAEFIGAARTVDDERGARAKLLEYVGERLG